MNKDWDGIWIGRSSIQNHGWETEIAIPFKSLNFHPNQERWGLKLLREIQHRSEIAYWPVANIDTYKFQVSDAGVLIGLQGITQGLGIDIRPYALAGIDQQKGKDLKYPTDLGLDVFYQITPGLKSVVTLNTDFAQTEVDDRQVNLTRFRLFFKEKRDFFLDGANYFHFSREGDRSSPKSTQLIPFFFRRIGLSENGNPIPIIGGVKVTGQTGKWNLGLLDVVDDRKHGRENFTVLRLTRNFGSQSTIGIIGTSGNAISDEKNNVIGADVSLATSTFRGDKNLEFLLFGLKSTSQNLVGNDCAFGSEISYPNDFFSIRLGYSQIENNFFAGVGFVPRKNIRNTYFEIGLGPRPKKWGILQFEFESEFDYITDLNNRLLTREIEFTPVGIRFLSGEEASFKLSQQFEVIDKDFNIFGDFIIPYGTYNFWRYAFSLSSAQRRNLFAEMNYKWGNFWNGNRKQTELELGYKVCVPLFLGLEYEHNDVDLPVGNFYADVFRFTGDILFSPRMTLNSFIQYDNDSQKIGWQSRFRWIIKPGNEIIFVWNSIWRDPLAHIHPSIENFALAESTTRLKINYNYRF